MASRGGAWSNGPPGSRGGAPPVTRGRGRGRPPGTGQGGRGGPGTGPAPNDLTAPGSAGQNARPAYRPGDNQAAPQATGTPASVWGRPAVHESVGVTRNTGTPEQVSHPSDSTNHLANQTIPSIENGMKDMTFTPTMKLPGKGSREPDPEERIDYSKAVEAAAEFPLRRYHTKRTTEVFTNHFALEVDTTIPLFLYNIVGLPTGVGKATAKIMVKNMIQQLQLPQRYPSQFVTDYDRVFIAWVNIPKADCGPVNVHLSRWKPAASMYLFCYNTVNMQDLWDYALRNALPTTEIHQEVEWKKTIVNMIISTAIDPQCHSSSKTNKFFDPNTNFRLSDSLAALRGYFYSVKPSLNRLLLNVNVCMSAFYKPILVSEFLADDFTFSTMEERCAMLRGLRVRLTCNRFPNIKSKTVGEIQEARLMRIVGTGKKVNEETFTLVDANRQTIKRITVETHFLQTYQIAPKATKLPAINCGSSEHKQWYPPDVLRIEPNQQFRKVAPNSVAANMIKYACINPGETRRLIEETSLAKLQIQPRNGLQTISRCPALKINLDLLLVKATTLPLPELIYAVKPPAAKKKVVFNASWNLEGENFIRRDATKLFRVYIIAVSRPKSAWKLEQPFLDQVWNGFSHTAERRYSLGKFQHVGTTKLYSFEQQGKLTLAMESAQENGANFVLLVLSEKNTSIYSRFKDLADRRFGMQSECIVYKDYYDNQYWGNIAMKLNLKAGGGNHTIKGIKDILNDTLVLGADVTHPSPSSLLGTPSIAAVVGSINDSGDTFLGDMRLQARDTACEIIQEMAVMAYVRIGTWASLHGNKLPKNILYFRDGVSNSQYTQVVEKELVGIRRAFYRVAEKLKKTSVGFKLTAVVVTKRHHTRFFHRPAKGGATGKNGNTPPGTVVDSAVTSPYFQDFYLQSHDGIKGTARPAHYFPLVNEMGLSERDLQEFTYRLCHTYVRASKGVSYAPPAYYADRLCERARCYMRDFYAPDPNSNLYEKHKRKKDALSEELRRKREEYYRSKRTANGVKSEDEKKHEQKDKEQLIKDMKQWTLEEARKILYEWRSSEPSSGSPFHENIKSTMFWM